MLHKYLEYFFYFYKFLRHKVAVLLALSMTVGVLDGFGLTMFIPLLQMVNENSTIAPEKLGRLRIVADLMISLGLPLTLVYVLLFLCVFFMLKGLVTFFSNAYAVSAQQFFIRQIRLRMLGALNNISFKFFITSDVGRIQNTMSGEVDRVSRAFASYFKAFEQVVLVFIYMGFAFLVDAQFAMLVCIGGVLTNIIYRQINKKTKAASRILTGDAHHFQSLIIQHVANFKYLKATGSLFLFGERLIKKLLLLEKSNRKIGKLGAFVIGAREPLLIIVVTSVIIIQVKLLGASLAPILVSLLFFYRALTALLGMQTAWNYFLANVGSIENMSTFQKELDSNFEEKGCKELKHFSSHLQLANVNLNYGKSIILKNINLQVKKNETIAFVGESGSGKTSLVNILAGLLPPDSGKMLIDDIDQNKLELLSFQKRIGYITQEPVIFNDTIFNNVTFWADRTAVNFQRFQKAITKAAIQNFIEELPEKENTELGNNGINLSGGQKQRISIARELYKEIDILIMDEATSALDSETERSIQENIDLLKGEYTILIVAHRLSTIKNADRIIVLNKGEIERIGTYHQLLNSAPTFRRMVSLQEL